MHAPAVAPQRLLRRLISSSGRAIHRSGGEGEGVSGLNQQKGDCLCLSPPLPSWRVSCCLSAAAALFFSCGRGIHREKRISLSLRRTRPLPAGGRTALAKSAQQPAIGVDRCHVDDCSRGLLFCHERRSLAAWQESCAAAAILPAAGAMPAAACGKGGARNLGRGNSEVRRSSSSRQQQLLATYETGTHDRPSAATRCRCSFLQFTKRA